ncbi:UPAR/Ly6 domain-containing protein bou-like [Mytilus galloprovincialis]|uniref:Protein sleepless n=1 Tax=Mytilus galloprovincialis TaxID=29158 RepID=A0A8B6HPL4_MYTGA|nr:Hypothetical predicted protein [Mytilus galloprovincialis]
MKVYSCYLAQILLFLFYDTVDTIDCYVCTSLDKDNKLCMDGFKKNLATSIYISRKCDFDFFKATHCIKLKGVREDGTEILVRQCGDNDWGSHCGDIMYTNGDSGTERINGCLETCDHDGCNTANQMFTFQTCIFTLLPSLMFGIFRL